MVHSPIFEAGNTSLSIRALGGIKGTTFAAANHGPPNRIRDLS